MSKAISTIIAVILMLIITIALAGTAYMFITGILTSKMSKTISVLGSSCNGTHITLVISNDGTDTIGDDEIKLFVNNENAGTFGTAIDPRESGVKTISTGVQNGTNTVLATSPSNFVKFTVWC